MKATGAVLLGLLLLAGAVPVLGVQAQSTSSAAPASLQLSLIPATLPANSGHYPALVISLQDASRRPTMSLSDITVYLSSSNVSIASVPSTVTILGGHPFVDVEVATTHNAGIITLSATSVGLATASVTVRTSQVTAGPTGVALFVSPSKGIQAFAGNDQVYAVQLITTGGRPAFSTRPTDLVIASSNEALIGAPINVTIPAGDDVVFGQFSVNSSGTGTLTALAPELAIGSALVNVAAVSRTLSVSASPPLLNGTGVAIVTVSVTFMGLPAQGISVTLSTSLGTVVPTSVTTGAAGTATAKYISGPTGPATITATAQSNLLGTLKGSTTIIVKSQQATTTRSGGILGVFGEAGYYLPLIAVAVVVAVALVLVRLTIRRRRTVIDDEYSEADSGPGRS